MAFLSEEKIELIFDKIKDVKIALYGDFCLDAYWLLDPRGSEISVETGLQAQAVKEQKYSLGGASNLAANIVTLNPKEIKIFGVAGNDIFGREMTSQLNEIGVDTKGLVIQKEQFETYTFSKLILEGEEQPRIDFGRFNKRTKETDNQILENLRKAIIESDIVIINQQVPDSITNREFIDGLNKLIKESPDKLFIVDSRHFASQFENAGLKINEVEAAKLCGVNASVNDVFGVEDVKQFATKLHEKHNKPIFISRGNHGILACDKGGMHLIHGLQFLNKLDTVGAGDTAFSAIACALAANIRVDETISFANFAAGVTVQKLYQTGTASPAEILEISSDPNYIYQPELAEDIRAAKYIDGSEIEICYDADFLKDANIKHAVFDHDGTISVLREGWELVMEPMMIKAILGDQYKTADEHLYHKVKARSIDFIDKSTGIQTVVQMQGLVEIVEEFNIVPKDQILDKFGYKEIYNDALMEMVTKRVNKLKNGELGLDDFAVKGAVDFLKYLSAKGVKLYLASGTDREDVIAEAEAMGYADLFDGGIHGAIGDISKYSKKMVLEKIIRDNNLSGSELMTLGDGPVEMRECRKVGGIAIGIASDEVRRHGLDVEKRMRLIKAGAQLLIPDFSQREKLQNLLFE